MRQMARNLKNMRKIAVSQGKAELAGAPLESFITPQCFEIVVEASLMSSAGVEGEGTITNENKIRSKDEANWRWPMLP